MENNMLQRKDPFLINTVRKNKIKYKYSVKQYSDAHKGEGMHHSEYITIQKVAPPANCWNSINAVFWLNCFPHKDGIHPTLSPQSLVTG